MTVAHMSVTVSAFMAFTILSFVLGVCSFFIRGFALPKAFYAPFVTWLVSLGAAVPLFEPVGLTIGIPAAQATSVGSLVVVMFLFAVYMLGDYVANREHSSPLRRWLP